MKFLTFRGKWGSREGGFRKSIPSQKRSWGGGDLATPIRFALKRGPQRFVMSIKTDRDLLSYICSILPPRGNGRAVNSFSFSPEWKK